MTTQRNKVHAVSTLTLVARQLGVDEDWLADVAIGMEPEDGLIWVHGPDDPTTTTSWLSPRTASTPFRSSSASTKPKETSLQCLRPKPAGYERI